MSRKNLQRRPLRSDRADWPVPQSSSGGDRPVGNAESRAETVRIYMAAGFLNGIIAALSGLGAIYCLLNGIWWVALVAVFVTASSYGAVRVTTRRLISALQ
jgi:hypothetical protein